LPEAWSLKGQPCGESKKLAYSFYSLEALHKISSHFFTPKKDSIVQGFLRLKQRLHKIAKNFFSLLLSLHAYYLDMF
jgi:hypothetical protein